MKKVLSLILILFILFMENGCVAKSDGQYVEVMNESQFIAAVTNEQNIILMNDIVLGVDEQTKSWVPLSYTGELNGNNKSITVYTSTETANTGIFSTISGNVKIYDLTIYGIVESTEGNIGSLAGNLGFTSGESEISNVKNYATVSSTGIAKAYAGGIIGNMSDWTYSGTVTKLRNYGSVSIASYAGGIVGLNKADLSLCANMGDITATGGWTYAGGIVARNYNTVTIFGCYNSGTVSLQHNFAYQAAGIVGVSAYGKLTVESCYNNGNIETTGNSGGGIVGKNDTISNINNCYNVGFVSKVLEDYSFIYVSSGNVTASNCYYMSEELTDDGKNGTTPLTLSGMRALGSDELGTAFVSSCQTYQFPEILGNLYDGYTKIFDESDWMKIADIPDGEYILENDITLGSPENTYHPFAFNGVLKGNGKTVTVYINETSGLSMPIGLFTELSGSVIIENLSISGMIYGSGGSVGGLAGNIASTTPSSKIVNCVNNASVTTDKTSVNSYVGGLIGNMSTWTNHIILSNLVNNGAITGYNYVGGIIGLNKVKISNSANHGTIHAVGASGGIAGRAYANIEKSYNSGNLTGAVFGGIVGTTGQSLIISDSYNTGDISASNKQAGIIADATSGTISINNCYNVGTIRNGIGITDENAIYNSNANIAAHNCYYLNMNESHDDGKSNTVPKNLENMKSLTSYLGESFVSYDSGYQFPQIIGNTNNTSFRLWSVLSTAAGNGTIYPFGEQYVKDGETLSYQINASSGYLVHSLNCGDQKIAVYNNTSGGEYDTAPIHMDCTVSVKFGNYTYYESENGIFDLSSCEILSDLTASDGECVRFLNTGHMVTELSQIQNPVLRYPFQTDETDTYYAWVRIFVANTAQDSIYAGFDNTYEMAGPLPVDDSNWYWYKVKTAELSQGSHTFDIYPREYLKIDKVLITNSNMFIPTGMGQLPDEEPQQIVVYDMPEITPPSNHPRVYFTGSEIPEILENSTKLENQNNWQRHLSNLDYETDGILSEPLGNGSPNFDSRVSEVIESLAFDYAIRGNEQAGHKAITTVKNFINTLSTNPADYVSTPGMYNYTSQTIHLLGIVYDWCYNLLTVQDKAYFHRMFLYLASNTEIGWPPVNQSGYCGHGTEGQLQRDMMCAAIAMYDEYPYLYQNIGGRFFEEYVDAKKFMYQGHTHNEGDHYFQIRYQWEMLSALLFDKIGLPQVFGAEQQYVPYWYLYARRPDGSVLRSGDSLQDNYPAGRYYNNYYRPMLLAAGYYQDPYLKWEALRESSGFQAQAADYNRTINCVEFLIFNDPDLEPISVAELPLSKYFPSPFGGMIARTGWEDGNQSPAVVAEMKIKEYWHPSHAHLDAGAFQIYYKGALANDTGFYASSKGSGSLHDNSGNTYFGSDHFYNYYRRTIAHNCMLVYDPQEECLYERDGGQKYISDSSESTFHEFMQNYDTYRTGEVLGHEFGPDSITPDYTYLKGDLSYAYSDKVSEYERSFMFLNLEDTDHPAAMLVFDRVVSSDASFKKTWLLHGLFEPTISGTRTTFMDNRTGYNGKMIVDTLLPEGDNVNITKIGGSGFDFYVNGTNWTGIPSLNGVNENANGWRMELSPVSNNFEDYFLNVIQVGNITPAVEPLSITKVESDTHVGAQIADRIVLFGKGRNRISENISFDVSGTGTFKMTVADLNAGSWQVLKNGENLCQITVLQEGGIAFFEGGAGNYTLIKN